MSATDETRDDAYERVIRAHRRKVPSPLGDVDTPEEFLLDKRLTLKAVVKDYLLRRAMSQLLLNLLFWIITVVLAMYLWSAGHADVVNYVQKVLLKGYEPEHSGTSVITTAQLNDFFLAPEVGLVDVLVEQERADGAIYYADEVRLLAVRMHRTTRPAGMQSTDSASGSGSGSDSFIGSGSGSGTGSMLCDSDGQVGATALVGNTRLKNSCGKGMDSSYNLKCLANSDEPPTMWTHNTFMRELYKGKPVPEGTMIPNVRVKQPGVDATRECSDTGQIWLYHASLNSSCAFKQYVEAMRDASVFTKNDIASASSPSLITLGTGPSWSPSVKYNSVEWPVHWIVPPIIPLAANLSIADVTVDSDSTATPNGNVTLSDGSVFVNPGRIQLLDETVETVTFSVLGYSIVTDGLLETSIKVSRPRGSIGSFILHVNTWHHPRESVFTVPVISIGAVIWCILFICLFVSEIADFCSACRLRQTSETCLRLTCNYITSTPNIIALCCIISRIFLFVGAAFVVQWPEAPLPYASKVAELISEEHYFEDWVTATSYFHIGSRQFNTYIVYGCFYVLISSMLDMFKYFRFHDGTAMIINTVTYAKRDLADFSFILLFIIFTWGFFNYLWLGQLTGHDDFRYFMYAFHTTMLSILGFYNVDSATAQSYGKQGYVNVGASYILPLLLSWVIVLLGYIIVQNLIIGIVTDAFEKAKTAADDSQRLHVSFFKALKGQFVFWRWFYGTWLYRFVHYLFGACGCAKSRVEVPIAAAKLDNNLNIGKDGRKYLPTRAYPNLSWKALRAQFFSRDEVWEDEEENWGCCLNSSRFFSFLAKICFALTVIVYAIGVQELSLEDVTRKDAYDMMMTTAILGLVFTLLHWMLEVAQPPQQDVTLPKESERFLLARSEELSVLTSHLMLSWDQWGEPIPHLDFLLNDQLSAKDLLDIFQKFSVGNNSNIKRMESNDKETPEKFFEKLKENVKEYAGETEFADDFLSQCPLMNINCAPDSISELNLILILAKLLNWDDHFKVSDWMNCRKYTSGSGGMLEGADFARKVEETALVDILRRRKMVYDRVKEMVKGVRQANSSTDMELFYTRQFFLCNMCCQRKNYRRKEKDKEIVKAGNDDTGDDDKLIKTKILKEVLENGHKNSSLKARVEELKEELKARVEEFHVKKINCSQDHKMFQGDSGEKIQIKCFSKGQLEDVDLDDRTEDGNVCLKAEDLIFLPTFGLFCNGIDQYPYAPLIDALVRTYGSFDHDLEAKALPVPARESGRDCQAPWIKPVIEKALVDHEHKKHQKAKITDRLQQLRAKTQRAAEHGGRDT